MPSATGSNWEKYKQEFADDEKPEKKITPLTDECVFRARLFHITVLTSAGISKYSRPTAQHPTLLR